MTMDDILLRYGPAAGEDGPVKLVEELFNITIDPWQKEVLRAWARGERRISVASCHGPGKTACAAWLVWCMLLTRYPQKTVATAPSKPQLQGGLLPEIKMWGTVLPDAIQALFDVRATEIALKAAPDTSFFQARTARAEKPEALQGVHAKHVLIIADEASGIPEEVYEAAVGSMSDDRATTLLISNPTRTSGYFFNTHHIWKHIWRTITVSYTDSTRVGDDFVEQVKTEYGEDSPQFNVRCLGLFPKVDEFTVIPFEYVESARQRDIVRPPHPKNVWGLDVARFGGDRNVLVKRTNRTVYPDIKFWTGIDLMATAGRVKAEWDETKPKDRPKVILIDIIGLGSGVHDRLQELGLPVRGINVAEAATFNDKYLNTRAELWWRMREWFGRKDVSLPPAGTDHGSPIELLCRELVAPKYDYASNGKIRLESKDQTKKTLKGRSPDFADALALTFAEDLSILSYGSAGGTSWNEPIYRDLAMP